MNPTPLSKDVPGDTTPATGRMVNPGITPPHKCDEYSAPGRPSVYDVNDRAVFECSCGTFWQMRIINVVDYEGDPYGTENRWFRVKNAAGDDWKRVEVDPAGYLTNTFFGATCSVHGRVRKSHRHTQWV